MDALFYISGILFFLGLPLLGIGIIVALIKPHLVNKHRVGKNQMSRKKIATTGVSALLVSVVGLSSVMTATEPASLKQEQDAREAAEAKALQLQQAKAEKSASEKAARKHEEQANKPVVKTETKTKVVKFKSTTKNDNSMPRGQTKLSVAGVNGERTITYEVTYVRGKETGRKEIKNKITTKPVTQVTLKGTYVKPAKPKPRPAPQASNSGGVVKMSDSGICHAPGTTYYSRTKNYTAYNSLSACLNAGGRLPKR